MKKLSDCEQIIMDCLWSCTYPQTLPEIQTRLENTEYEKWKPQTLSTFLRRMIEKDLVDMKRIGRKFWYTPLYTKEEYYSSLIAGDLQEWLEEENQEFLLLAMGKLDAQQKQALKELLNRLNA